jgi:hypothetical protein
MQYLAQCHLLDNLLLGHTPNRRCHIHISS